MSRRAMLWTRRMVPCVLALVMAAGGFPVLGMAYALDDDADDVLVQAESADGTEEVNQTEEDDLTVTEESVVALEQEEETALVQEVNSNAVAYVTKDGVRTTYDSISDALNAWTTASGDVGLTLQKDVQATVSEPVRFTSSGKKTLNLNGCTATFTVTQGFGNAALIETGRYDNDQAINVGLVIDDNSGSDGALVCNNVPHVIQVSGFYRPDAAAPNFSSSLELRGGTISGGTQNVIMVIGNEDPSSTTYGARLKMSGGTIGNCVGTAGTDEAGYGVRLFGKALFEMRGGTICQNAKGGVYLKCNYPYSAGTSSVPVLPLFAMDGGTISNNGAEGVLMAKDATFTMHKGTISNNAGAGVAISSTTQNSYTTFTMSGGEIAGNATGVLVSEDSYNVFNLEGSPKILGNGSDGQACNVLLKDEQTIHIVGALTTPSDGPQVGVTKPKDGTDIPLTTGYNTYHLNTDPATFFKSDVATAKAEDGTTVGNAYICWHLGENDADTGPYDPDQAEAARLLHTHDWQSVYQYALSFNDGKAAYEHKENVLTAKCSKALIIQTVLKHGACPYVTSATLTLSAQSKVYDGMPVVATLIESKGWKAQQPFEYDAGKITYFKKDGTALAGAPKDVGEYVAQFKLDGDESDSPDDGQRYDFIRTSFEVRKTSNGMTVTSKSSEVLLSKVKKKARRTASLVQVEGAQGAVSIRKVGGSGKLTIDGTGRVTVKKGTKKGTYKATVRVTAAGDAAHEAASRDVTVTVKVVKKLTNPMVVAGKTATVKAGKTVAAKKLVSVKGAKGKVTYKKASGNKKITTTKSGKVTVRKGLKPGTYKVKLKVTAAGNGSYKKVTKTVTCTVIVK